MDFKDTGRGILMALLVMIISVKIAAQSLPGPEREVISVYNEDFTTPCNRTPYFIEVYRCVKDNGSRCSENQTVEDFIVPNETENITIVVPDTGNKTEFYSYVIYNHTSCKCGTMDKRKERPEPAFTKVAKDDFKNSYLNNPVNLFTQSDRCNSSQPRYKKHSNFIEADSKYKYLSYNQCLPGCFVVGKNDREEETYYRNNTGQKHKFETNETITDDVKCKAFWPRKPVKETNKQKLIHVPHTTIHTTTSENAVGSESAHQLLVYIGSEKLVIAAFVVSLVLFSILIMDFVLWRRKKGFLYALFRSDKNDDSHCCLHSEEGNRKE